MKKCCKCKKESPVENFYKNKSKSTGLDSMCRDCRKTDAVRVWEIWIMRAYKLTASEYQKIVEIQGNRCAICGEYGNKKLCVDHCHVTGKIRGLLCRKCNTGLGSFVDNVQSLKNAIVYLERK